jgi:hypothetical protein
LSKPLPFPEGLPALADEARSRIAARSCPPRIRIEKKEAGWEFSCPYGDEHGSDWFVLLADAFGTRHHSVVEHFLNRLIKLLPDGEWNDEGRFWYPDENALNTALAVISSMRPENEGQAAHAAQLVALDLSHAKLAEHINRSSYADPRAIAILAKTTRAYGDGLSRLAKLQGKIQPRVVNQTIEVHKHEHVHFTGGVSPNGGQPHGAAGSEAASRAALPSPREVDGEAVQMPGGEE